MKLLIERFAQIESAEIDFGGPGDLTVLIGQQATGKSLTLQWLKLLLDADSVRSDWDRFASNWKSPFDPLRPLDLFFGEGLSKGFVEGETRLVLDGRERSLKRLFHRSGGRAGPAPDPVEHVYFIPAHRALLLSDGWPRYFQQHVPGTPYVARAYSERLARWLGDAGEAVFPIANRLQQDLRSALDEAIFHKASLAVDRSSTQSRLILKAGPSQSIPYMAWTAGQREFVPLLIALYELMPAGKVSRLNGIETVVLEEPELGLHPHAVFVVGLAILAMLDRGYRVVLSTHSPLFGDFAWAINRLRVGAAHGKADESLVRRAFGMRSSENTKSIASAVLRCHARTYHLGYGKDGRVRSTDISALDSASLDPLQASWGGLLQHSYDMATVISQIELDFSSLSDPSA